MKTVYSDNDLLLFLFDEMPLNEANALVQAISQDDELLSRYEFFQRTSGVISSIQFEPSDASIEMIEEQVKKDSDSLRQAAASAGSWRTALLTGVCVLAFGFTAFWGNMNNNKTANDQATASAVTTSSVATDALWDDDSFTDQIQSIESRTKELQDPIL